MRQKQTRISRNSHGARKRTRKRRRSPVRVITIVLCFLIGGFFAYKITNDNKLIMLANNFLVDNQSEASPINTVAPENNDFHHGELQDTQLSYEEQTIKPNENQGETLTDESSESYKVSSDLNINSANAVLIDFGNGTVLFDKNGTTKMYPASMTKIMTAIVALEHIKDLDERVLLNETIFQPIYNANASTAGFLPGENVRAIDLLYGLLLPSGAECAVGLAEFVAGSESKFVSLMNDKAQEMGMSGSNFTNTAGLHDNNHYSTAMDMAVLLQYALANNTFYEIITSAKHSTPSTNRHEGGITYYSTLFSKVGNLKFEGGSILGGKTGFTVEAGQCLASFAIKDGNKYILITSGANGNNQTQQLHIDDAFDVYASIYNSSRKPDTISNDETTVNNKDRTINEAPRMRPPLVDTAPGRSSSHGEH